MSSVVDRHLEQAEKAKNDARKLRIEGFPEAARIALIRAEFHEEFARIEAKQ